MKAIKRGDVLRCIGSRYYARGQDYFAQGMVSEVVVHESGGDVVRLESVVKGSGKKLYEQEITITCGTGVNIQGLCSCPVSYNCKHVVAACLQYLHQLSLPPKQSAKTACFSWLDKFSKSGGLQQKDYPEDDFLIYLVGPSGDVGKLEVEFRITRILKNGELGKGRETTLNYVADIYDAASYLQPLDRDVGRLLSVINADNYHRKVMVEGDMGYLALMKMVQSGRCYLTGIEHQALQMGEPRNLLIDWQQNAQGDAQLSLEVEDGGIVLLTKPPLYIAPESLSVGPLGDADVYTFAQLEQLIQAPKIPAELIPEFSQQVAKSLPTRVLPPPQSVEIEELQDLAPVPVLHLFSREEQERRYHLMRLRFAYGDHEISLMPEDELRTLNVNDRLVRVERNAEDESSVIEQLEMLGFEGRLDNNQRDVVFVTYNIEHPMEGVQRWQYFLDEVVPQLVQHGWRVEFDESFQMAFHEAEQWHAHIEEQGNDWFDLSFDVEVNHQKIAILPLVAQVLESYNPEQLPESLMVDMGGAQYLTLQSEQIKPIIDTLYELYDGDNLEQDGSLKLSRFDAARLNELEHAGTSDVHWRGGKALRNLGKKLTDFSGIKQAKIPRGLKASLRDYQHQGLSWLQFLREYGFGGILADDMGLGKTVQTLAHLLLEKERRRMDKPCLIVAPTSLMSNWYREAQQFAPSLKVLVLQGPDRHGLFDQVENHDVVLSTYPLLVRDEEKLLAHDYYALVLDEAQVIKNPRAKAAQVIRGINAEHRLCLTGTPMENHLGELWALFDFLMPGFLGSDRQFKTLFRTPIEKHADRDRQQQLAQRVAPFMLRRTKAQVAAELPDKTEIIRVVNLGKKQAALYESIRLSMEDKVRKAIADKGLARSHITILDALLKLRQACCDPQLLSLTQARSVKESAKMELLMQLLPEMIEEGRRILLFSQFTKMLSVIESALKKHAIAYTKLTGQTRNRDEAIQRFKKGEVPVFLISLKAGGVGLNLTEADTVIHYDPWWNPAAENQATDRAHRIGQDKAVFVYKLITENSVEEKIMAMQTKKQALAQGVYNKHSQGEDLKLTADDMKQLFAPL